MKLLSVVVVLLAPLLTSCAPTPLDCSAVYDANNKAQSGVYLLYPSGIMTPVEAHCDMDTDGGRWTLFHRRMDGSVNFYRPFKTYKKGFGDVATEYWLGLDSLHFMTRHQKVELLIEMEDFEGNKVSARYKSFAVGDQESGYELHVSGFVNGGAGDSLSYHSGQKFSTYDMDRDSNGGNCAKRYMGAFWYKSCHLANPNGVYRWGRDNTYYAIGIEWYHWKGYNYSLKTFTMKARPVK